MHAKTALGRIVAIISIASALALIVISMIVVDKRPRTHDAYIFAYSAGITPEVSGRIVAIHVRNDQFVHKGDVLLQIDPEPFELKVQQANAQVAALQADIDLTGRQVNAQGSGAEAAEGIRDGIASSVAILSKRRVGSTSMDMWETGRLVQSILWAWRPRSAPRRSTYGTCRIAMRLTTFG